ncbi:hyoscyamine 6-dioxygenase-like [Melia azedarach]|uniref:Hyoscyamine 6-dioxygenase-like n=1 Tax=Melia azedarach TaxID=155640 RepID=A0ACC1YSR7_MELAZ|nr:hyoscyamine 6-dioxygenase-like [Melia azedarach]
MMPRITSRSSLLYLRRTRQRNAFNIGLKSQLDTGIYTIEAKKLVIIPPCPDAILTLGLPRQSDPNLVTILPQGDVPRLQVFKDGEWIGVEPIPNAFVINFCYVLQIISNNKLKSAEHRAVADSKKARTSAAFFTTSSNDNIIEPAKALTDAGNHPIYKTFQFEEFLMDYISMDENKELVLELYKRQA